MAVGGIGTYAVYSEFAPAAHLRSRRFSYEILPHSVKTGYPLLIGLVPLGSPTEQHDLSLEITIVDTLKSRKGFMVKWKSCSLI